MIAASLDIGSNSILLLIAVVEGGRITPLKEKFYAPRLGRNLEQSGRLSEESMAAAIGDIDDALDICRRLNVEKVVAAATAAVREADNGEEFCKEVMRRHGLKIEIIDGSREAELTFSGAIYHLSSPDKVAVLDVGGGSSECTIGIENKPIRTISIPMGAVKLAEELARNPEAVEEIVNGLSSSFSEIADAAAGKRLIGVGGTITTLASVKLRLKHYDSELISQTHLSLEELREMISTFRSLSTEEVKALPGMEPNRADIIESGAIIVQTFITLARQRGIEVSAYGLRYGLLIARAGVEDP